VSAGHVLLFAIGLSLLGVPMSERRPALADRLDSLARDEYRPGEPGAVIVVRKNGHTLFHRAYGVASLDWNVPIAPTTRFRLGSVTKQFTAAAVLMLVQDGRVALDEPLARYVPEMHEQATIRQLLLHRSGLKSLPETRGFDTWSLMPLRPADVASLVLGHGHLFEPGTDWHYSDAGYVLLGLLIERVSGRAYADFLQARIFAPLGMVDSAVDDGASVAPKRATGYRRTPRGFDNVPYRDLTALVAAGGVVSTAGDLVRWDDALYESRLVRPDLLRTAFEGVPVGPGASTSYGFGWARRTFKGRTVIEHGGSVGGVEVHLLRVPDERVFIGVLTNSAGRARLPDFMATRMLETLWDAPPDVMPPVRAEDYTGCYRLEDGSLLDVGARQGTLRIARAGGHELTLTRMGIDEFRPLDSYARVLFARGHDAHVEAVSVHRSYQKPLNARRVATCGS
jgi:D-alanyl-D-alanine carboxypeptidase